MAEARELYDGGKGLGYKRIAKHFGVTRDKAREWVRPDRRYRLTHSSCNCGRPRDRDAQKCRECRRRELRANADERADDMRTLRTDGLLDPEIAELFGCTTHAVAQLFVNERRAGRSVPPSPYPMRRREPIG